MNDNFKNNNLNNEQANFGLPEGYFKKSAVSIFNKIEWEEEHKHYVELLKHKNKSSFVIPENYFTSAELKLELFPFEKLVSRKKNNPFVVPQNYFETNISQYISQWAEISNSSFDSAQNDITSVTLSEVEVPSELKNYKILASLNKKNSFVVSQNYFIETEEKLKQQLTSKPTKVINLFSQKAWYSVAALLVIALGFWAYNNYFKIAEEKDCGTLACVDKVDLVKAKHLENIEAEDLYKLVNTKKLEENLDKKVALTGSDNNNNNKENVDSSLKSVSSDELLDEL